MDDFLFSDEPADVVEPEKVGTWKVIIVDDEPEVHAVTKLALSDFEFQNKRLEFISAYSGEEAKKLWIVTLMQRLYCLMWWWKAMMPAYKLLSTFVK